MAIINAIQRVWNISDIPYWHILSSPLVYHNAHVGQGIVSSASVAARDPNLKDVHTTYSLTHMNDPKELEFERVRVEKYPYLPSRLKPFYLFDSLELAERAKTDPKWFNNRTVPILNARICMGTGLHRADTEWLNCTEKDWIQNAEKYWSGEMSNKPFPEVLVDGYLYFPDWKSFPWGPLNF